MRNRSSTRRPRAPARATPRRRSTLRRVVTALVVIVAVLLVTGTVSAFVVYYKLNGNITKENVDQLCSAPTGRPRWRTRTPPRSRRTSC